MAVIAMPARRKSIDGQFLRSLREPRRAGRSLGLVLLTACLAFSSAAPAAARGAIRAPAPDPVSERASAEARRVASWAIETADHHGAPFLIVDKIAARVFAFDGQGLLLAAAPALLGLGKGDRSPAGIGSRQLSSIAPAERITPAGRFVAALGKNLGGKDILWVDYDAAISLHRVDTTNPKERRLQRLASPTASDNRISYGCVNVPPGFFEGTVVPLFSGRVGIVYILPEARSLEQAILERPAI